MNTQQASIIPELPTLEPEFQEALQNIIRADNPSVLSLIHQIDESLVSAQRETLSSAIRVFVLKQLQGVGK